MAALFFLQRRKASGADIQKEYYLSVVTESLSVAILSSILVGFSAAVIISSMIVSQTILRWSCHLGQWARLGGTGLEHPVFCRQLRRCNQPPRRETERGESSSAAIR